VKSSRSAAPLGTMGFVDWVGLVGGSISTIFSWTAFNRDSFADNVVMRQNQKYQQKNYQISWVAIAREDIRDMMGISVNRINNYMLVATLILGMAGGALTSLSFAEPCPGFLMYASYLSVGISIVFLVLSIVFGVTGQNEAFKRTMALLTNEVRPQSPDTYGHDYMSQAQWIEKQGLTALFRIPGVAPERYDTEKEQVAEKSSIFGRMRQSRDRPRRNEGTNGDSAPQEDDKLSEPLSHTPASGEDSRSTSDPSNGTTFKSPDEGKALEELQNAQQHTWYLHKFRRFMELWQPYDTWSKYSMSLGILSFGHGLAYWSLGKLMSERRPLGHWAGLAMFLPYIYVVTLIAYMNLGVDLGANTPKTKASQALLMTLVLMILVGGPVVNGISTLPVISSKPWLQQVCVLSGYSLHCVFWLLCFIITLQKEEEGVPYKDATKSWKLDSTRLLLGGGGAEDSDSDTEDDRNSESSVRQRRSTKVADESADTTGQRRGTPQSSSARMRKDPDDGEKWPTDDPEFDKLTNSTMRRVRLVVEFAIGATALMWAGMCVWVVGTILLEFDTSLVDAEKGVHATWFSVDWPDPLFEPGQMACAADEKNRHVFVANKFSIYSLQFDPGMEHLESLQEPEPCGKLEGEIIDMAALCDDHGGCRPFVLIRNHEFTKIVDCARPEEDNQLKWTGLPAPNLIEVRPDGLSMVVEQESNLVIWTRKNSTSAWVPQYDIGIANKDLGDIDYGFREIIFFRNVRPGLFTTAIEQFNATSMEKMRAWRIPNVVMPLAAGCMMEEGAQALVLPSRGRLIGSKHHLARLDLNR